MSTHNIYFHGKLEKYLSAYSLSGVVIYTAILAHYIQAVSQHNVP